jgi:hypothetical protein
VRTSLRGRPGERTVLLTASPAKDLVIPSADYSFGQLRLALARRKFESLGGQRRPVIRLHLVRGLNKA